MDQAGATARARSPCSRENGCARRRGAVQPGAPRARKTSSSSTSAPARHARRAHLRRPDRPRHDAQRQWARAAIEHLIEIGAAASPSSGLTRTTRTTSEPRTSESGVTGRPSRPRDCPMTPPGAGRRPVASAERRSRDARPARGGRRFRCGLHPERHARSRGPESARRVGLRVPDDVAVIGFDNIESPLLVAVLSSVDPGRDQIAKMAVDLLLERIKEKGERVPPRQILADYHIVPRESTGFSRAGRTDPGGVAPPRSRR